MAGGHLAADMSTASATKPRMPSCRVKQFGVAVEWNQTIGIAIALRRAWK